MLLGGDVCLIPSGHQLTLHPQVYLGCCLTTYYLI